jgi:hypothetical protein
MASEKKLWVQGSEVQRFRIQRLKGLRFRDSTVQGLAAPLADEYIQS